MTKVVITQSNYIPWKGYFDQINLADILVIYDDMQFTKRDWRNRNQIKTPNGLLWLTIPVEVKGKFDQKIKDTKVSDKSWANKHFKTIQANYAKAKCYRDYKDKLGDLYEQASKLDFLTDINLLFINWILQQLNIKTTIKLSSEFSLVDGKTERLVDICLKLGATDYISGPAAKNYMDVSLFEKQSILVSYMDYSNYPVYSQLYGDFTHAVSIIDLFLNVGSESRKYMKSFEK
jgi:hypothetical protein